MLNNLGFDPFRFDTLRLIVVPILPDTNFRVPRSPSMVLQGFCKGSITRIL